MQWRNEIELHTDNLLKTLVWHGSSRETSTKELKKYDVVCDLPSYLRGNDRLRLPQGLDFLCSIGKLLP